ncbi:MAG: universal stress protein [Saprospiraceae bacterium]|nr:universal stress protein [Saprospiraceae bacterium]
MSSIIVDVRSLEEWQYDGHAECTVNYPLDKFPSYIESLRTYDKVVLVCRSGNRANHAMDLLKKAGIKNVENKGTWQNVNCAKINGEAKPQKEKIDTPRTETLKVLIPTDFSVQAEYAYIMVQRLAERANIDIHFAHVLDVPDTVTMGKNGTIETCGEIDAGYVTSQKNIVERKLNNLKTLYGEDIQTHLILGKVTQATVKFAEENDFDLVVMGTKGAWGLKEMLSGTEAQSIARRSKVPLLTLMCDRSDLDIENILLVHDFTKNEKADLKLIHKLIKAFNTKIHLLQVVPRQTEREEQATLEAMKQFAAHNKLTNIQTHIIKDSDVEKGVTHFAQLSIMDIICIGTHGKGGFFHKSATEKLINHLFKPIISFHLEA